MNWYKRTTILILAASMTIGMSLPQNLVAQSTPPSNNGAPTGKTMADYVAERGFNTPNGAYIDSKITNNRANFDIVRDYAVKYAPMAGADPVLVVWWAFIETGAPVSSYTWNNCHNNTDRSPDYICPDDDWQVGYGQQYNVAYNHLVKAFEAVYGNPNDKQKVQQVIQDVLNKSEIGGTAPSTYTVADLQSGGRSGEARKWALMLSRDPGISVYLLSTALIHFNRQEAFSWGQFYVTNWQNYSNALNDVIEAWGIAGTPGSSSSGGNFGPTEPPINLEVPDCSGIVREINAFNLPPSIYPKPNCGAGTAGAGAVNGPTGVCTTDPNVQAYGTGAGAPPDGSIFWTIINATSGSISQGFGPTDFSGSSYDNYDFTLGLQGHPGVDISSPSGTKLYTPVEGKVISDGGTPYFLHNATVAPHTGELKIELSNGDQMVFGHMERIEVNIGDTLKAGDYLGTSGIGALPDRPGTGGPHLHLEYRKKLAHADGEYTGLDPRDVFGCAVPSQSDEDEPNTSEGSGTQVEGITTRNGQVLQANSTVSPRFGQFQQKYGLDPVTGASEVDFEANKANFTIMRDHAVKYAPMHNLDPEILVMWALTETLPPYDSYSYSNCNNRYTPVTQECGSIGSGDWQVGYGQQYSIYRSLPSAFDKVYGNSNDAVKVREVIQNVLQKSGDSATFSGNTVDALVSNEGANRKWIFALSRDPALSMYLLGQELAGDFQNAENAGYGKRLWDFACDKGWGSAYCAGHSYRERFSNTLNDALLNWGIAGSAISGEVCQVGVPSTNSNCSTIPDNLNGLEVDEFVEKINQNMAVYKEISQCANVPWEMMAAIHLRETSLLREFTRNRGGPWQLDPPPAGVDANNFAQAGCWAGKHLAEKIEQQFGGQGIKALTSTMDPTKQDDEYAIKAAFFGYNGTGGWQGNVAKGCTQALDGNDKFNWDCSAYVMNNMDSNHSDMCIVGSIDGGSTETYCDGNDGAWKIYYKLFYSTYDANGQLLVYGGRCNVGNEVIGGMSAPTKAGKSIITQYWAEDHHGIDIANSAGDPVFAIADGEIVDSGWNNDGGYYLILHIAELGDRPEMWVYYGHLDSDGLPHLHNNSVSVLAGQSIAKTGPVQIKDPDGKTTTNGVLTSPRLHLDLRRSQSDKASQADHINPCTIDVIKNSYNSLECFNESGVGPTP